MNKLARKSTPPHGKYPITYTGSILNTRNTPGARPYCNHQLLKKFCGSNKTAKNLTPQKFFTQIFFSMSKIPYLRHQLPIKVAKEMQSTG